MTWISRGPTNIGGCAFGVAIDPASEHALFAAAAGGGCWRLQFDLRAFPKLSFGDGPLDFSVGAEYYPVSHWTPTTDAFPILYTTAVALCDHHPTTVYCATGHPNENWKAQVWRSDDRGGSWRLPGSQDFRRVYRLAVDPDDPGRLYVAAASGLWRSTNGAVTWTRIRGERAYDVVIDPDDPTIVFAGIENVGVIRSWTGSIVDLPSGGGILRSLWTTVLPWSRASTPNGPAIRIALAGGGAPDTRTIAAKLDQEVFTNHQGGHGGAGAWVSRGKQGGDGQRAWSHVIAVDPFNPDVLLTGGQDLFRTVDGGANWVQVAGYDSASHPDQQQVVFDPRRRGVVYLANDGGIWGSLDGGASWPLDLNGGFVTAEMFRTAISGSSAMSDMYHEGLIGTTNLASTSWGVYEGGGWEFKDTYGDPKRPGRFFVFSDKLGLRRLFQTSPGVEFGDFNTNVGDFTPRSIDFDLRRGSNTIVVGTNDGRIMRAKDGDSATPTWIAEAGVEVRRVRRARALTTYDRSVVGLAFAPADPGLIWAVSSEGVLLRKRDVNTSRSWSVRGIALTGDVAGLAVNACHSERVYLLRDGGVEMTPDGGSTFVPINGSGTSALPGRGLRSLFAHPSDPGVLIVGAVGGIFISTDEGATWGRYDADLPNAEIKTVFMAHDVLYAGTVGRGLWRRRPFPSLADRTRFAGIAR